MELLQHISPDRLVLVGFLLGVWWSDKRASSSRRDQGRRIGDAEKKIEKLLAALGVSGADGK